MYSRVVCWVVFTGKKCILGEVDQLPLPGWLEMRQGLSNVQSKWNKKNKKNKQIKVPANRATDEETLARLFTKMLTSFSGTVGICEPFDIKIKVITDFFLVIVWICLVWKPLDAVF